MTWSCWPIALVQELNNRRSFYDYDFYRYVAGVKGDFSFTGNNFLSYLGYDAGVVYERADYLRIDSGDATRGGIYREIIAGAFNPFIGVNAPLERHRSHLPERSSHGHDGQLR